MHLLLPVMWKLIDAKHEFVCIKRLNEMLSLDKNFDWTNNNEKPDINHSRELFAYNWKEVFMTAQM